MSVKYKHSILLVDDEVSITKSLQRLFRKEGYQILTASGGQEGLGVLQKTEKPVSLIISDQRMPQMTGAQFLEKAKEIFPDAIRFLLTGYSDMEAIVDAVNKGEIHRYLNKPWNDDDLLLQVRQALEQYELVLENKRLLALTKKQNKELSELNKDLEKKVNERTLEIRQKNKELEKTNKKLEEGVLNTIRLLSSLVETFNPRLGKYMRQVARLSRSVAEEYGLGKEELDQIEIAGMIHDIGLFGLRESIMEKDEADMTEHEFKLFIQHPAIGQVCVEAIERLDQVGKIILSHHEHYDGNGFPNGLRFEEIPLESRIIGMVSDYCRIVNLWPKEVKQIVQRAHKYFGSAAKDFFIYDYERMINEVAKKIILLGANQKYDIEVVTAFFKKLGEIQREEDREKKQIFIIPLEDLKEGMVLAKNVRVEDGRILLAKDAMLKETSIETIRELSKRGIIKDEINVFASTFVKKLRAEKRNSQIFLVPLEDLKEGMVLGKNLRAPDGRILIAKGTVFNMTSIDAARKFSKNGVIDNQIYITA